MSPGIFAVANLSIAACTFLARGGDCDNESVPAIRRGSARGPSTSLRPGVDMPLADGHAGPFAHPVMVPLDGAAAGTARLLPAVGARRTWLRNGPYPDVNYLVAVCLEAVCTEGIQRNGCGEAPELAGAGPIRGPDPQGRRRRRSGRVGRDSRWRRAACCRCTSSARTRQRTPGAGERHNGPMTTPEPRTTRCPACGYRFVEADGQQFCSGLRAGNPPIITLLAEAQRLAAYQALAARRNA